MPHPFDSIDAAEYVNLTTYRKNGQAKHTPVWAAVSDGQAYVWTQRDTWKVKRLRANPESALTPCNVTGSKNKGPAVPTSGRILPASEAAVAKRAMRKKYGLRFGFGVFFGRLKPGSDHAYLAFTPRDE